LYCTLREPVGVEHAGKSGALTADAFCT